MSSKKDGTVDPSGVFHTSERSARIFAEIHDKDVVETDAGSLAKNRPTQSGPMPTKAGDVIVRHANQLWEVWSVPEDDAQAPDPNEVPRQVWSLSEAEQIVRELTEGANAQIFWLQKDGNWTARSN